MSFADRIREELLQLPMKKNCCRRAFALGLLLSASLGEGKIFTLTCKYAALEETAFETIRQSYGNPPALSVRGRSGHRYWDFSFRSPAFLKLYYRLREENADPALFLDMDCEGCRSAFLRGLFLSAGTVSDPHKNFHLEMILPRDIAPFAARVLESLGYPPKAMSRPLGVGLYYKDSGSIEELLTLMGVQHLVFEVINSRIERDIRNNENRATNCVAKNIEKTISAAARQMDAINFLMEKGKLDRLPEQLRATALLRYRNPDATLDELAQLHEPPISKSGLNHRLQKVLEEAAELERKETT